MPQKSYIEHFVKAFARTHNRKSFSKKDAQRAIALIDIKLDNPCCTDSSTVTDLFTSRKGVFLNTFEKMLELIPRQGNIASLQRTKNFLSHNIGDDCCPGPQGTNET